MKKPLAKILKAEAIRNGLLDVRFTITLDRKPTPDRLRTIMVYVQSMKAGLPSQVYGMSEPERLSDTQFTWSCKATSY